MKVFYFGTWNDLKPGDIRGTFLGRFGGTFFIFVFAFSLFDFGLLGALIQMLCEPQRLEFFIAEFASLDFWLRRLRRSLLLWLLGRLLLLLLFLADDSSPFFLVLISCDLWNVEVWTTCFADETTCFSWNRLAKSMPLTVGKDHTFFDMFLQVMRMFHVVYFSALRASPVRSSENDI